MKHEEAQNAHVAHVVAELTAGHDPYPRTIEIHPTDLCNHRCAYCYHGGIGFDPKKQADILTLADYEAIFGEMRKVGIQNLSIAGGGEPLLDPRLGSILALADTAGLDIRLVTHGNLVRGQILERVLSLREIRFSIDALYPSTYALLRQVHGALLNDTFKNLADLIRLRTARRADLSVGVSFLVSKHNAEDLVPFCASVLALGVDAVVIKHDIYGLHNLPHDEWVALRGRLLDLHDSRIDVRDEINRLRVKGPCYAPHFMVVLNPYGDVYSCALGSQPGEENGYLLGNLRNGTLEQVWQSSNHIRAKMRTAAVRCTSCNHTDIEINGLIRRDGGRSDSSTPSS